MVQRIIKSINLISFSLLIFITVAGVFFSMPDREAASWTAPLSTSNLKGTVQLTLSFLLLAACVFTALRLSFHQTVFLYLLFLSSLFILSLVCRGTFCVYSFGSLYFLDRILFSHPIQNRKIPSMVLTAGLIGSVLFAITVQPELINKLLDNPPPKMTAAQMATEYFNEGNMLKALHFGRIWLAQDNETSEALLTLAQIAWILEDKAEAVQMALKVKHDGKSVMIQQKADELLRKWTRAS